MNKKQYQDESNFKYGYFETTDLAVAIELDKTIKSIYEEKTWRAFLL